MFVISFISFCLPGAALAATPDPMRDGASVARPRPAPGKPWVFAMACLVLLLLAAARPAVAQIGVNEFLPRHAPILKRFSIVATIANNQCLTVQLASTDLSRLRPDVLLGPCEFSIDNQVQGFFISRTVREKNQIFFAANPAYCLAMDPRNRRLLVVACGMSNEMFREFPQFWDLRRGGLSLDDTDGRAWCLDSRAREGFSQIFEPYFIPCETTIADSFLIRINR